MHIDEEIGVERHRGRRRRMRALVAASLAAALGACSGVSTKNDPEAERIVKKVIEAQKKYPNGFPIGGKDEATGGADQTITGKTQADISAEGQRQKVAIDAVWRTDADQDLGSLSIKLDAGNGRTVSMSMYLQYKDGSYVVYRELNGEWVQRSYERNELIKALNNQNMTAQTKDWLKNAEGLTYTSSGNEYTIKGILNFDPTKFAKVNNATFDVDKDESNFTIKVNKKDHSVRSLSGTLAGSLQQGTTKGDMKMDLSVETDRSTSVSLSIPKEAKDAMEGDPFESPA